MPTEAGKHPDAAAIGERLTALRDHKGWTNDKLADCLGMAATSVSKLLAGNSTVQFVKLGKLAFALGTTPDEILGFRSGKPEGIFRAVLAAAYIGLGFAVDEAEDFAAAVIRSLDERPTDSVKLDPETSARFHVELAARRFAHAAKPRKILQKKRKARSA